jgi:hypothetical protein
MATPNAGGCNGVSYTMNYQLSSEADKKRRDEVVEDKVCYMQGLACGHG